eukprot:4821797-Pleurochrysis_carterae.AAC.1
MPARFSVADSAVSAHCRSDIEACRIEDVTLHARPGRVGRPPAPGHHALRNENITMKTTDGNQARKKKIIGNLNTQAIGWQRQC